MHSTIANFVQMMSRSDYYEYSVRLRAINSGGLTLDSHILDER